MAEINKPKRKERNNRDKGAIVRLTHKVVYDTVRWRNLRKGMLMQFPLCQMCLRDVAVEVHHRRPISDAKDEVEMMELGFSPSNLVCLCARCHDDVHRRMKEDKNGKA